MQTLGTLLTGIVDEGRLAPHRDRPVSGVFDDSRRVMPEGVFVALRGSAADGRTYVEDAVRRGAAVIVGEDLPPTLGAVVLNVPDARATLARAASRWYGLEEAKSPAAGLKLLGVTGTNGKSTTAHMAREILNHAGIRCGMLGTVQYDLCGRSVTADMTTPGPVQLASYLRECADRGGAAVVMEVSSHALDQRRCEGLRFDAAAFTNLTQDHLDYHRTMEAYGAAKARLFETLESGATAIVNRDDPAWQRMARDCRAKVLTFGLSRDADICATITRDSIGGTLYRMRIDGRELALENALVGRHNVYNAMAAAGLALAAGAGPAAIEAGLTAVRNIPGRLQRVPTRGGPSVFIDYAHTDDALRNVGSVLGPLTKRRLIIVFGCGGDRDKTKRPKMARAAAEFGHAVIVTSDNPRTEQPDAIIADILSGFPDDARRRVLVEPDRRKAIRAALAGAGDGDVVLIAGKGHEDYQIIGTQKHHFDDIEVALQALAEMDAQKRERAAS